MVKPEDSEERWSELIIEALEDMPTVTIDCTGFEKTVKLGLKVILSEYFQILKVALQP